MGYAGGTISQEELEKYSGAGIMLMNTRDGLQSGSAGDSGYYQWSLNWNTDGFTGVTWEVGGDLGVIDYSNATREEIQANGYAIANNLSNRGISSSCATFVKVGD